MSLRTSDLRRFVRSDFSCSSSVMTSWAAHVLGLLRLLLELLRRNTVAKHYCKTQEANMQQNTTAKHRLHNSYYKAAIARQRVQNINCKTTVAKHQLRSNISKAQLQNTVAKQEMFNKKIAIIQRNAPRAAQKSIRETIKEKDPEAGSRNPFPEPNRIAYYYMKNPCGIGDQCSGVRASSLNAFDTCLVCLLLCLAF